ncbi:hypothetical protein M9Y10_038234 [Tritrichomonas musculus]|uniref:Uncharacterized protein n=1 Tax=Tritrichomonas musculus TaxID=1915356 RepID=A0ABR2K8U6_9EUKA
MIFLFLYLSYSENYHSGFYVGEIHENKTSTYELNAQILFFRYFGHEFQKPPNISVSVEQNNITSDIFFPTSNRFYQLKGDKINIHSFEGKSRYQLIIAESKSCDDYVFAFSLTNYINTTITVHNQSRKLCYIFYEPDCDYRINFDCLSNNRNTLCQIYSKNTLITDLAPVTCQSNSTCEETLEDGFLATVQGQNDGVSVIETSLKVLAVKGKNSALKCEAYEVDYIDIYGIHSINKTINNFLCEPAKESVIIAVVLVTVLLFILISGVLVYYKCRPNRDAYESDEAARRKPFSRNYRRNSEVGARDSDMYTQIGPD